MEPAPYSQECHAPAHWAASRTTSFSPTETSTLVIHYSPVVGDGRGGGMRSDIDTSGKLPVFIRRAC